MAIDKCAGSTFQSMHRRPPRQGRVFKPRTKTKMSSYEEEFPGEFARMGGGFMVENQMFADSAL